MAEPVFAVVNIEETPDKVVGKRRAPRNGFKGALVLQETANDLRKAFGHGFVPKGVFRFHTHEEADEWMMRMLVRRRRKS